MTTTAVVAVAAPVTVPVTAPETTAAATAITTSAEDKEVADLAEEVDSLKTANAPAKALIYAAEEKMLDAKVRNADKGIASTLPPSTLPPSSPHQFRAPSPHHISY